MGLYILYFAISIIKSMKRIINQLQLDRKIHKAEKLNKKLTQILSQHNKSSKTAINNSKPKPGQDKSKQQEDLRIINNINDRIKIYKYEISKMNNLSTESFLNQIKRLEESIRQLDMKSTATDRQIKHLEDKLKKQKKSHHDVDQFSFFYNQAENLKKKLANYEVELSYVEREAKPTTHSMKNRKIKSVTKIINQLPEEDHRKKIDKEALYRNLIKYYENQQTKLKQEISQLQKQANREQIQKQILEVEQKIAKEKERLKM